MSYLQCIVIVELQCLSTKDLYYKNKMQKKNINVQYSICRLINNFVHIGALLLTGIVNTNLKKKKRKQHKL